MITSWIIVGIAYLSALPFVFMVIPTMKERMGWDRINLVEFISIWLIMPVFLIIKLFNR